MAEQKKGFDIKKNWPIVAAGGVAVLAYLYWQSSQAAAANQNASALAAAPSTDPTAGTGGSGGSTDPTSQNNAASIVPAFLSYLLQKQQIGASNYQAFNAGQNTNYGVTQTAAVDEAQIEAQVQIAQAAKPSFLQQLTGFVSAIAPAFGPGGALTSVLSKGAASAVASYAPASYGGFSGGGPYLPTTTGGLVPLASLT